MNIPGNVFRLAFYRPILLFLLFVSARGLALAQVNDRYSSLLISIGSAEDKLTVARELVAETNKQYTAKNAEYFNGYFTAGLHVTSLNPRLAIQYMETAAAAYRSNHTTYIFPQGHNNLADLLIFLSSAYSSVGLTSTAIQVLESYRSEMSQGSNYAKCGFMTALGDMYRAARDITRARKCYEDVNSILRSGQPMLLTTKKDPAWQRKANETLEPIYRNMRTLTYNTSMGNFYYERRLYDSAATFLKVSSDVTRQMEQFTQEKTKISRFVAILMPDSFKIMNRENEAYQKIYQQLMGSNTQLIVAYSKTGKAAEAKVAAQRLNERITWHMVNNQFADAEVLMKEAQTLISQFGTTRHYKWAESYYNDLFQQINFELQAMKGNYAYALAESRRQLQKDDKALQEDFAWFSDNERKEYFQRYSQRLNQYYSLLLAESGKNPLMLPEMLNKRIQTKGLILDATRQQAARFKNVSDPAMLADISKVRSLREKINAFSQIKDGSRALYEDSVRQYTLAVNTLQKKINATVGAPATIMSSTVWQDLQTRLTSADAFVEIVRVERDNFHYDPAVTQYWAFIVKKTGAPDAVLLGEGETFEKGLKLYANNIRFQHDDNESYDRFWKKINDALGDVRKVYFSADGVYHLLNPVTLKNSQSGRYLLDEIDLIRLSTARDLLVTKTAGDNAAPVVLIGNPDFSMNRKSVTATRSNAAEIDFGIVSTTRSGFMRLPGTEKEVGEIAQYAGASKNNVVILANAEATEMKVKMIQNPSVLHFATHGAFDGYGSGDAFLKSKLILAGAGDSQQFTLEDYANYEDGLLTAYEVTQMNLEKTNLVVLSACETGLGEVQAGEGVWGLQRAFQVAGARVVLGSLWKVSDEATALFMSSFYKRYFASRNVSQAYVSAMKETRTSYPQPYYWGAFVVTE